MSSVTVKMTKVLGHWKLFSSDDKWDEYMRTLGKSQAQVHTSQVTISAEFGENLLHVPCCRKPIRPVSQWILFATVLIGTSNGKSPRGRRPIQ